MINVEFTKMVDNIADLNHQQRLCLRDKLAHIPAEKLVCDLLEERIESSHTCVHCGSHDIIKKGTQSGLKRYFCKSCKHGFNAVTGTSFARLRMKEKWLDYLSQLLESTTIRAAASGVGVNIKTSFRWRHRFLNRSHHLEPQVLSGIVEASETFFSKSMKGSKKLSRSPRERGSFEGGSEPSKELVSVFTTCDRNGGEAEYITGLGPVKTEWLDQFLTPHLDQQVLLITDKTRSYKAFCDHQHIEQIAVLPNQSASGSFNLQHVNSYHRTLKRWMSRFNGVATKYLNNYLGWCHELFKVKLESPIELLNYLFTLKELPRGT